MSYFVVYLPKFLHELGLLVKKLNDDRHVLTEISLLWLNNEIRISRESICIITDKVNQSSGIKYASVFHLLLHSFKITQFFNDD